MDKDPKDREAFDRKALREKRLGAGFVPLKVANLMGWPQFMLDQLTAIDRGKFSDEVLDGLREAVAARPEDRDARLNLAVTLAQYGLAEEAEREARGVVEKWPEDADGRYLLGNLLADLGRDEEAEENLRRAAELDPGSPAPAFYLGEFLMSRGRTEEALEHYRKAIGKSEVLPCAFTSLEDVLSGLGREQEALEVNDRLLAAAGEDAAALLARAWHLLRLGRMAELRALLGRIEGMKLAEEEREELGELVRRSSR